MLESGCFPRCGETGLLGADNTGHRIADLNMPLPLALAWKRDNTSPLLANFIAEVQRLPDVRAINKD
jgi:hypothetical protein